jgi:hypothetical protein
MTPEYAFVSHWQLLGTTREISEVLGDALQLPRWWPSVYLKVEELAPGDPRTGVGRTIALHTRGRLPYTLRWSFRVTESDPPNGFKLAADGDFVGTGEWIFAQDGEFVDITYDWRIRADKPLLRFGTPILRPIFAANHRWAMAQGERSLDRELRRRRGAAMPAPPD